MISSIVYVIAGVHMTYTTTTLRPIPQDIMIVFDISLSMLAEDISPSRITVAKSVVRDFIAERKNDRVGLIIFAGKPFVSIPFSTDYAGISSIVSGLYPDLIRQDLPWLSGTNIGDALLLANMTYSGSQSQARSIILLTDWRANIGIDPIISATESREKWIKIFPVGIGSLSGAELSYTDSWGSKQYFSDGSGGHLRSDLDEPMMRQLADITGGQYFHAEDKIWLTQIFSDIRSELPSTTESKTETKQSDITPLLLILFMIWLTVERVYLRWIMQRYRLI